MYQILTTDFPGGSVAKNLPANVGDRVKFLVLEDLTSWKIHMSWSN